MGFSDDWWRLCSFRLVLGMILRFSMVSDLGYDGEMNVCMDRVSLHLMLVFEVMY